jgi:hypothetical protein
MSTLTNTQKYIEGVAVPKLLWAAPIAGLTAFIANLVIYYVGQNLLGVSLMIPQSPGSGTALVPLTIGPILGASIVPAIGAAVLLAVLGRFVNRPFRVFQIIAAVFLLLSFGGPLFLPVGGTEKIVMASMHLATAAAVVAILSVFGRSDQ